MPGRARPAAAGLLFLAALAAPGTAGAVVPHEVAIARGIELINAGEYRAALAPLEEALAADPANAEALFYAGLASSRLGAYGRAEDALRRALAESETPEVYYELGRVAALTGRCDDAGRLLERSAALAGTAGTAPDVAGLLDTCRGRGADRRFAASLSLGWQHDSNVVLDPDNPATPRGPSADNRTLLYLTAGGKPVRAAGVELDVRYAFYASRHEKIDDYNAVHHQAAATLAVKGWEALRPTLGYTFEHTSFGGDAYGAVHTGVVGLAVPEGERFATELSFEGRSNRFRDSALFPDNADRTGEGWSVLVRQRAKGGPVEASVFGALDHDDAREPWWESRGWRAGGRVSCRIADPLVLGATAEYRAVDYDAPAPGDAEAREDRIVQIGAALTWAPWRHGSVSLTASRTRDNSNLDASEYRRFVYGVAVTLGI